MPFYDNGRTRANLLETTFTAPFDPTPAYSVTYDVGAAMRPAAVTANGMIFWYKTSQVAEGDELVVATALTGQRLWSFNGLEGYSLLSVPPVVAGDEVFVAELGYDDAFNWISNVVALDRHSGALLWRNPSNISYLNFDTSLPIVVQDGIVYLTWENSDIYTGYITAVNARTGGVIWETTVDSIGGFTADALAITNNVLVAMHFTHIVGYDLATGTELWEYDVADATGWVAEVDDMLAVDGKVAFTNSWILSALDVTDGSVIWSHDIDQIICESFDHAMASDGDVLSIMGMCEDQLRAYDLDTGVELWSETVGPTGGDIAIANNAVYVNAVDWDNETGFLAVYRLSDGQALQRLDVTSFFSEEWGILIPAIEDFSLANGQLLAVVPGTVLETYQKGTLFFWGSVGGGYLPLYNEDGVPDTNPDSSAEVSIIDRDGSYGAEISVAAKIGVLTATLKIYHSDGQVYKEAVGNPDAFGNGFWIAPLEYATDGYDYQVILFDGTELPRRQILMPADPASNVSHVIQTSSLSWQGPPAAVNDPYTLTLSLPGGFPPVTTTAVAYLQSPGRGMLTIPGERVGNEIKFPLERNTAVNGDFVVAAVATAGNVTAFSPDLALTIDVPEFADVSVQDIYAFELLPDGSVTGATFDIERHRPPVDADIQADVQFASVVPDPAGYQVTLWVTTPSEDSANPLTSKWEVGIAAYDADGNELDRVTDEVPASPDGFYIVMDVTQPGTRPIASLVALGATLEETPVSLSLLKPGGGAQVEQILTCHEPGNSDPPSKKQKASDLVDISVKGGLGGEVVAGVGPAASVYTKVGLVSGQVKHCLQSGVKVGGGVKVGPEISGNMDVKLRGLNHDERAYSGFKISVKADLGLGLGGTLTFPRKGEGAGLPSSMSFSVSAAPSAGVTGGFSTYICSKPEKKPSEDDCCTGPNCPHQDNDPPPPGNDHPDDTLSVVLENDFYGDAQTYWRTVFAYANYQGFSELADYARYRQLDLSYIETISTYPAATPLSDERARILRAYESNRLLSTVELHAQWGTISAQMDQMEADQANVLANGYYGEMQSMLSLYGIPNRLISPDFSPDAITGSMIVIPTAGLYGLEADTAFAARLERFVSQGGTLLVMTQPGDNALDLLPGTWDQVDYQQDQSCWVDAMTLIEFHPILASVSDPSLTSHVDGFMTTIPGSAQLLMERTKNQQGALVFYEYGQGRMIVTNMYDDWGRTVGQSSRKVRNLFRDVARWASIGDVTLPEVLPGQAVQLNVDVTNVISETTTKVEWIVRDPNGLEIDSGLAIQDLALSPGQSSPQTANFTPGSGALGIWYLNYRLLDNAEEVLQGETQAGYFIVKDPPVLDLAQQDTPAVAPYSPGATDTDVSLTLDQAAYQPGETVTATLTITLSNPGAVSGLKVNVSMGGTTLEKIIPTVANQQVNFNLPADFDGNGLFFYGVYESAGGQGLHLNTQWIQPAGTDVTIVPASPTYTPGQTVTLNITGDYTRTIFVLAADFARSIDVSGTITATFDLPEVLSSGPVQVQYGDGGFQRTARFDIIGPRVTVKGMNTDQPLIAPGGQADIYASIESDQALDVLVAGQIIDGDGFIFPTVYMTKTLIPGQQTLTMTMPISTTTSGSVRYQMEIFDATKTAVSYVQAHRFFTIDAPALQAVRAAGGPSVPSDKPEVSLDWYAPSAAALEVILWLDGTAIITETVNLPNGFTSTDLTIPGELDPGVYELYAAADLSGGVTTSVHGTLTVVEAGKSILYLPMVTR